MNLDERNLETKLEALERARTWSPRVVSKLETLVRGADEAALFRVNAIAFAAARDVGEREAIDLFLHATRLGLFTMEWQLVCPQCTDAVDSVRSLASIGRTFHCDLCRADVASSLDDLIHVTFTVSPSVRRIAFHDPESLPIEKFWYGYHFCTGAVTEDGRLFRDCIQSFLAMIGYVEPHATRSFDVELHPGVVKGSDRAHRAELELRVRSQRASETQRIELRLENGRFSPLGVEVDSGPARIDVHNAMDERASIVAINVGADRRPPRATLPPSLTGKRLFVSQTFRELFRSETIGFAAGLELKDLTIVFTDLKGSTALYDRIGDLQAFQLVQQHFDRLARVVREHDGAIVKTIGDAIMGTFASPVDAVRAARAMIAAMEAFNEERAASDLSLKVGVHRGASIAVTLNDRLDYFGQTVNIAARVQGLANAGEICMTDDVLAFPGVAPLLEGRAIGSEESMLRGISGAVRVHRVT